MTTAALPLRTTAPFPRRAQWWLAAIALWTLFPILVALQHGVYATYLGEPIDWPRVFTLRFIDWYTCALFTPVCFWLVRRFPRNYALQLGAVLAGVVVKYLIYIQIARWLWPAEAWKLGRILAGNVLTESIAFAVVLAIVHGVEAHRRHREREIQTARLEAELASARLDALTAQLQPHFLFNTLNGISTLMRRDLDAADEMLSHLGSLLHRTLRQRDRHEIPLSEELEVLEQYLAIMKIRFQDRLIVNMRIEDGLSHVLVPPLILQPLVENAIRHGISRKPGAGLLEITAVRAGSSLEIAVRDDGEGVKGASEGVGLTNTRRRLRELYGDAHALDLTTLAEGGSLVTLRIPLR